MHVQQIISTFRDFFTSVPTPANSQAKLATPQVSDTFDGSGKAHGLPAKIGTVPAKASHNTDPASPLELLKAVPGLNKLVAFYNRHPNVVIGGSLAISAAIGAGLCVAMPPLGAMMLVGTGVGAGFWVFKLIQRARARQSAAQTQSAETQEA